MPYLSSLVSPVSTLSTNTDTNPALVKISSTDDSIAEIAFYLGKLVKMSEALAVVDTSQRQRVTIDNATTNSTNVGVTLRDSTNVAVFNQMSSPYASQTSSLVSYGGVPDFWKQVDVARQNYQTSIRSNLTFS